MTDDERIARLTELLPLLPRMRPSFARRIAKYATVETSGCYGWSGPRNGRWQRPHLHHGSTYVKVARVVLEAARREALGGLFACHTCDNSLCIRPSHLFAGTHTDNMRDMAAKGRHSSRLSPGSVLKGDAAPSAKLTSDEVREIRAFAAAGGISHAALGVRYGVSQQQITRIVRGQKWKVVA